MLTPLWGRANLVIGKAVERDVDRIKARRRSDVEAVPARAAEGEIGHDFGNPDLAEQ